MTTKRCSNARRPVEFEVTMRYRQRRFPAARARKLCPEGIYVETAKLTLPIGTLVEIELDRWGRQWLIPSVVANGDNRGFELIFQRPQPELYRYVTEALDAPRPPVAGPEAIAIPT